MKEAVKVFAKCLQAAEENEVFTRYADGCRAKGAKIVREEDDIVKPQATLAGGGAEPPRARDIRKSLIDNSKNARLLLELGEVYVLAHQPLTASSVFLRVLELEPKNARAIASMGIAALYLGELDAAYDWFKKALAIDNRDVTALYGLSGLYKTFGFKRKFDYYQGPSGWPRQAQTHALADYFVFLRRRS